MKFGTDGIRAKADGELATAALKLGYILGKPGKKLVTGRDTRPSGEALVNALKAGVVRAGGSVTDVGIMPTAGVAYLTRTLGADYGIVISASHNPCEYNGLKVFDSDGYKAQEKLESFIEEEMKKPVEGGACDGKSTFFPEGKEKYERYLLSVGCDLSGMKILVDCSNGAAYDIAPYVFDSLGAQVKAVCCNSGGNDINDGCGSQYAHTLKERFPDEKFDIALAFDGDSDRLIAVDEQGEVMDGDRIMYVLASLDSDNSFDKVVGTVLSNSGTEAALWEKGIEFLRSNVGDKHVAALMKKSGARIGGEQSGHVILSDYSTTGDGILTAIRLCSVLRRSGLAASQAGRYRLYPQFAGDVVVENKDRFSSDREIKEMVKDYEKRGLRVLVRPSGTEPKIRVMTEGKDKEAARQALETLCLMIKNKG